VTPEALDHIEKARHCLARARTILAADVPEVAGREAYLAAFHAAQALICDGTGRAPKTHAGTHTLFAQLTKSEPQIDAELRQFLPRSYDMKAVADYDVGANIEVPKEDAASAIETAARFIEVIDNLLRP
jgi:uncharacterized protein (UPF0332 family)